MTSLDREDPQINSLSRSLSRSLSSDANPSDTNQSEAETESTMSPMPKSHLEGCTPGYEDAQELSEYMAAAVRRALHPLGEPANNNASIHKEILPFEYCSSSTGPLIGAAAGATHTSSLLDNLHNHGAQASASKFPLSPVFNPFLDGMQAQAGTDASTTKKKSVMKTKSNGSGKKKKTTKSKTTTTTTTKGKAKGKGKKIQATRTSTNTSNSSANSVSSISKQLYGGVSADDDENEEEDKDKDENNDGSDDEDGDSLEMDGSELYRMTQAANAAIHASVSSVPTGATGSGGWNYST